MHITINMHITMIATFSKCNWKVHFPRACAAVGVSYMCIPISSSLKAIKGTPNELHYI